MREFLVSHLVSLLSRHLRIETQQSEHVCHEIEAGCRVMQLSRIVREYLVSHLISLLYQEISSSSNNRVTVLVMNRSWIQGHGIESNPCDDSFIAFHLSLYQDISSIFRASSAFSAIHICVSSPCRVSSVCRVSSLIQLCAGAHGKRMRGSTD